MNSGEKISALVKLGEFIINIINEEDHPVYRQVFNQNQWFIREFVKTALLGLTNYLEPESLKSWIDSYHVTIRNPKDVGLVLAGNIPAVGFHDILCLLISDHRAYVKPSHKDIILPSLLISKLKEIEPKFEDKIFVVNTIENVTAVIATGSDNTARYLEAEYQKIPKLIRKNRSSIAVLQGNETGEDLHSLADDIFLYFGMGCRNVSKLFLPENYDLKLLMSILQSKKWMGDHQKFQHNYLHQKSLNHLVDASFIDGGFYLLQGSDKIISPICTIYYDYYKDVEGLLHQIFIHQEKIQTIVTRIPEIHNSVSFGKAQFPQLRDYSDGKDTLQFLIDLD